MSRRSSGRDVAVSSLIAGQVVVPQAGEHRELDVLCATEVVEDPVPAAGNAGLPGRRVQTRLEQRMLDRVRVGDERAEARQLDRGGRVQRDRDLARRVGQVVAEAVVERLDRVPDRMGVEEVDEQPIDRREARATRGAAVCWRGSDASGVAQIGVAGEDREHERPRGDDDPAAGRPCLPSE